MIHISTKLFSHQATRRLQYARPLLASIHSSSKVSVGSTILNDNWSIGAAAAAAGLSALGVGFAINNHINYNEKPSSIAQCEVSNVNPVQEEEEKPRFETIPLDKLSMDNNDGLHRSELAFMQATQNGIFNSFENDMDGYEQTDDEDEDENEENNPAPCTNMEQLQHFVSIPQVNSSTSVNVQPRMSIRHTNRKAQRDNSQENGSSNLLASSTSDINSVNIPDYERIKKKEKELLKTASEAVEKEKIKRERVNKRITNVRKNGLGSHQVYTKNMYFYQSSKIKEYMQNKFRLFALPSSEHLGKEMAYLLGTELNSVNVGAFTDGETSVKIEDAVRGKEVFVVCTTTSSNSIMELLLTISALRRGSAKRICAVIPYYGYSRQDRRTVRQREPIAAADMAKLLEEMGVDSVICVDLHNPLVKGFFSPTIPVDHLMPGPVAAAYFYEELFGTEEDNSKEKEPKEAPKITVVAAHENQVLRANGFRNALQKLSGSEDIRVALISNTKALNVHTNNCNISHTHEKGSLLSDSSTVVGDVEGRQCIIVDDIINTGGTMRNAIEMVGKSGASEVYAWATHGVIHLPENDIPQKIQDMDCLKYLLISNSVAIERELPEKIRKLSIAPLLAESVARSLHSDSIKAILSVTRTDTDDEQDSGTERKVDTALY